MNHQQILEFEESIEDVGAVVNGLDGRQTMLGTYMGIIQWEPLNEVCDYYSVKELRYLQKHYEGYNYLSPVFGVLGAFIKLIADKREQTGKKSKSGRWKKVA